MSLIPKHGGYRKLKTFQLAQLIYDLTERFCYCYIDRKSRTRDQMVQAARSGVQNIGEGSQNSGTSKKLELNQTGVARSSLEELRLDYEDFLRQREMEAYPPDHPALMRFKARRCTTLDEVRSWVQEERKLALESKRAQVHGPVRVPPSAELAANAALSLLNVCCYLLDRQLAAQAGAFEKDGGFSERLYRVRTEARKRAR